MLGVREGLLPGPWGQCLQAFWRWLCESYLSSALPGEDQPLPLFLGADDLPDTKQWQQPAVPLEPAKEALAFVLIWKNRPLTS